MRQTAKFLTVALLSFSATVQATPYRFEARHSMGTLRWSHMGFSNPTAQFSQVEGVIEWNAKDPAKSSVTATIPMSGLSTGVPKLDAAFSSSKFFDFASYPVATFSSTHVAKSRRVNELRVTGDLALHGVVRPVTLAVTINKVGTHPHGNLPAVGFEATTRLKRSDFGLGRFVPSVGDEIQINLTVEAVDVAVAAKLEAELAAQDAQKRQPAATSSQ